MHAGNWENIDFKSNANHVYIIDLSSNCISQYREYIRQRKNLPRDHLKRNFIIFEHHSVTENTENTNINFYVMSRKLYKQMTPSNTDGAEVSKT